CGFLLYLVEVCLLEADLLSGALTASLFAGLSGPADYCAFPKCIEAMHEDGAKSAAIGDEQGDCDNSPDNSCHGQEAAHLAASERIPGVHGYLFKHIFVRSTWTT